MQEAALDPHLSALAYRVLIYIGGASKAEKFHCMRTTAELAILFHVTARDVQAARRQLHRRGYLVRTEGVVRTHTGRLIRHYYYRTNLTVTHVSAVATSA